MTDIERLLFQMIEFDKGDAFRTQHFMKVYEFSKLIGVGESVSEDMLHTLCGAAILHDIGIIPCERKFGHCNGKMQEEYGPEYARTLLAENGSFTSEEVERICYLIAHHHTYTDIDGIDYQILIEADYLVNALEEQIEAKSIVNFRDNLFRTKTGINLLNTMFVKGE